MCYTVNTYLNANQLEVLTGKKMNPSAQPSVSRKAKGFDQPKLALTSQLEPNQIDAFPWGLIPHWVGNPDEAKKLWSSCLNARSESLEEKPSFRDSIETLRAVIWVRGFYEYRTEGSHKLPYFIENGDSEVLPLAGLISLNSKFGSTCTIITSEANTKMKFIHNAKERMPVVLPKGEIEAWINSKTPFSQVESLLQPYPTNKLNYTELNPILFKNKGAEIDPLSIPKGPSYSQSSLF